MEAHGWTGRQIEAHSSMLTHSLDKHLQRPLLTRIRTQKNLIKQKVEVW